MKTIAIFCRSIDPAGHPFKSERYARAYIDLLQLLTERGAAAYFVTHGDYAGGGVFHNARTTDGYRPPREFTNAGTITADLVFDKGGFTEDDIKVLNPPFVRRVAADKIATYQQFHEYQPTSVVCANRAELERALKSLPGDLVVVKQPEGNGGNFVAIGSREQVMSQVPDSYPMIAQEFIDTSVGIAHLVEGVHDLRVEIGGGKVWGGTLRTPAPGELRANLAQGGTARRLLATEIPDEAKTLALKIDTYFRDYPRHYAADFAHTAQGWKLIELNNNPGLTPLNEGPPGRITAEALADYLINICP